MRGIYRKMLEVPPVFILESVNFESAIDVKNKPQTKNDKRAAALRENLRKRKALAKDREKPKTTEKRD